MRDLRQRTVTAVVYGAVVVLAIFAPPVVFLALLLIAAIIGTAELLGLQTGRPSIVLAIVFFGGLVGLAVLRLAGTGAGAVLPADIPGWLILVVLGTWAADVVGYLVGSAFGRRRLAPAISPGKTWEGTLASFVAASIVAYAIAFGLRLPRDPGLIALLGVGPVALGGDLLESYVKRRAGVKDSGTILPGHGGMLDRLDGLTAVALFVTLVLFGWSLWGTGSEGGNYPRF